MKAPFCYVYRYLKAEHETTKLKKKKQKKQKEKKSEGTAPLLDKEKNISIKLIASIENDFNFYEGKIETCFPLRNYNGKDKWLVFTFSANFNFETPVQKLS